jgi:hypothetical protein
VPGNRDFDITRFVGTGEKLSGLCPQTADWLIFGQAREEGTLVIPVTMLHLRLHHFVPNYGISSSARIVTMGRALR